MNKKKILANGLVLLAVSSLTIAPLPQVLGFNSNGLTTVLADTNDDTNIEDNVKNQSIITSNGAIQGFWDSGIRVYLDALRYYDYDDADSPIYQSTTMTLTYGAYKKEFEKMPENLKKIKVDGSFRLPEGVEFEEGSLAINSMSDNYQPTVDSVDYDLATNTVYLKGINLEMQEVLKTEETPNNQQDVRDQNIIYYRVKITNEAEIGRANIKYNTFKQMDLNGNNIGSFEMSEEQTRGVLFDKYNYSADVQLFDTKTGLEIIDNKIRANQELSIVINFNDDSEFRGASIFMNNPLNRLQEFDFISKSTEGGKFWFDSDDKSFTLDLDWKGQAKITYNVKTPDDYNHLYYDKDFNAFKGFKESLNYGLGYIQSNYGTRDTERFYDNKLDFIFHLDEPFTTTFSYYDIDTGLKLKEDVVENNIVEFDNLNKTFDIRLDNFEDYEYLGLTEGADTELDTSDNKTWYMLQDYLLDGDRNITYKLYYKKTKAVEYGTLTTKYVDEKGNEIADTDIRQIKIGDNFLAIAKDIEGYKLKGDTAVSVQMDTSNKVVTFEYTAVDVPEIPKPEPETPEVPDVDEPEVEIPEEEKPEVVEPEAEIEVPEKETPEAEVEVETPEEGYLETGINDSDSHTLAKLAVVILIFILSIPIFKKFRNKK